MSEEKIITKGEVKKYALLVRAIIFTFLIAFILFLCAGTIQWLMGWVYMTVYLLISIFSLLIIPFDQEFVEERTKMKEGVKSWDKPIVIVLTVLYPLGWILTSGLDRRFSWSSEIPLIFQITALIISTFGNFIGIAAVKQNKFYARFVRIQNDRGHHVIDKGPYSVIRHPGYLCILIYSLFSAIALGSYWALLPSGFIGILIIIRTVWEDKTLLEELPGYKEYAEKVRYRLLPGIW